MKKENENSSQKKTTNEKKGVSAGVLVLSILIAIILTLIIVGLIYYFIIREPEPEEIKPEVSQEATTQEISEPKEEKEVEVETSKKVDPYEGWSTYNNSVYNYLFRYPKTAKVGETKLSDISMSPEEHAAGKTFEDLYSELTSKVCVSVELNPGIVHFSAAKNEDGFYTMCGALTGIGSGYDVKNKTETITVNKKKYEATVMELVGKNDSLDEHSETVSLILDDGTRITFSSYSDNSSDTWSDYLKNRPTLIKIIESYEESTK